MSRTKEELLKMFEDNAPKRADIKKMCERRIQGGKTNIKAISNADKAISYAMINIAFGDFNYNYLDKLRELNIINSAESSTIITNSRYFQTRFLKIIDVSEFDQLIIHLRGQNIDEINKEEKYVSSNGLKIYYDELDLNNIDIIGVLGEDGVSSAFVEDNGFAGGLGKICLKGEMILSAVRLNKAYVLNMTISVKPSPDGCLRTKKIGKNNLKAMLAIPYNVGSIRLVAKYPGLKSTSYYYSIARIASDTRFDHPVLSEDFKEDHEEIGNKTRNCGLYVFEGGKVIGKQLQRYCEVDIELEEFLDIIDY